MIKRRLGRTGLEVSIIGFGAIKLPLIDKATSSKVLNRALDLGVNFIDTARAYGDSEEKIGEAVSERREEFYISTKSTATTAENMRKDIHESLKLLRTDYIDLYLCHNLRYESDYQKVMGPGGAMEALVEAKKDGVIGHIGFSCHRFHETMERGIRSGIFEVIMVSYNILNDELVDEKILPLAKSLDVGVIAMKPLAGGILANPPPELRSYSKIPITAENALRFVLSNDAVSIAIPGMMSISEVEENVRVGETFSKMTEEERNELVKAAESLGKSFCRGCGYCQPCPQKIRIPIILRQLAYFKNYGLRDWARGRYRHMEVKADACVQCGKCVEKCPYSLDVPRMLKEAHMLLASS
ncbi:MAG: aldo/keto reductase [Nitrososphaerota archaeon]|nr:aldo/keto reductase [Candidatus Bathyarchaeota archaeon]MDW8048685.1 aldo/keto reductase [Nitrososphaerota archaeon]